MTPPPAPAAPAALGTAAAATTESKVEGAAVVDPKVAATVDVKVDPAKAADTKPDQAKLDADKAALELGAKPFTDVAQLKLAEGVKLDESAMKEFLPIAKELGLTAKQAQALVEFSAKSGSASEATRAAALETSREAAAKAAVEALKSDKEIGGANFEKSMALATKAVQWAGDPAIGKFLNETRLEDGSLLGDNLVLAKLLTKVGRGLSEDSKAGTFTAGSAPQKSLTQLLYGPGTVVAGPTS